MFKKSIKASYCLLILEFVKSDFSTADGLKNPKIKIILFAGVDPKSVFCAFFKQGLCKKGDKCKFSHDPSVEGKAAKRNLYADSRYNCYITMQTVEIG